MKKLFLFITVTILILAVFSINAFAVNIGDRLGYVLNTDIKVYINGYRIPGYAVNGKMAVVMEDLNRYGFDVSYNNSKRELIANRNINKKFDPVKNIKDNTNKPGSIAFSYVYTDIKAFIANKKIDGFAINGQLVIYIEDLSGYGNFAWDENKRSLCLTLSTEIPVIEPVKLILKYMPILTYHTSSETNPGPLTELYIKPSEFEKQIKYLSENGFTFCTFDDYYKLNYIDKPVFITFDDGYKANYTDIFPIIKKYNAKITIFLTLSNIKDEKFTVEMIREMSDSGLVKFESHTLSHPDLSRIKSTDAKLTQELEDSKARIEEITGKSVLALAYPYGEFNWKTKEKVKEFYSFGLSTNSGLHNTNYDLFEIRRIEINRNTSLEIFKRLVAYGW